jgi:putative photosynthetic complex assembly protein 2
MNEVVVAAGYAVMVWWFTTGIILFLDGLAPRTFRWSMSAATALLIVAAHILRTSSLDTSVNGAYTAFSCAIAVWGWLEMSFLMGFITGPRRASCGDHRCSGWQHFRHATEAIIYNELATLLGAVSIVAATWQAPNRIALWTYLVLWSMRLSAKLNLFLGVPNLGEKFLPAHLQYLKGFFKKRPMNFLFPVSVSASTIVLTVLTQRCLATDDPFKVAGYVLTISLLALAVLEHWFMVLPLPSEKMWQWALRSNRGRAPGGGPALTPIDG